MVNGNANSLSVIYKAGVLILFTILCFLGANIYNKVDGLPKEYVTLERYRCDLEEMKKGISNIERKLDRYIFKHNGE